MMVSSATKKMPRPFAILRIKSGPPPRINSARQPAHNEPARCPRSIRTWEWVPRGFPWLVHRIPHSGVRRGFDECADYFSFMGAHKQVEPRLGVDPQRVLSPLPRGPLPSARDPCPDGSIGEATLRKRTTRVLLDSCLMCRRSANLLAS